MKKLALIAATASLAAVSTGASAAYVSTVPSLSGYISATGFADGLGQRPDAVRHDRGGLGVAQRLEQRGAAAQVGEEHGEVGDLGHDPASLVRTLGGPGGAGPAHPAC